MGGIFVSISEMQKKIKALLPEEYPNGKEILETGKTLGDNKSISVKHCLCSNMMYLQSENSKKNDVKKQIMYHFQYGLTDFETSKKVWNPFIKKLLIEVHDLIGSEYALTEPWAFQKR